MKKLLLKSILLLCALVASSGSMWAAEGDTHDFSQSISVVLNNGASISSINIAAQSYPVKEVIISYTHNKSLTGDFVTASCSVGGDSWGSEMLTCKTTTTQSFTGSSATGAIAISFTNHRTASSGQGTFQVTNVRLVEGAASTKVAQPSFSPAAGAVEAGTTVTISSATDDATIYYTMGDNPADPTTSSTQYTGPITINEATTIKAIAVKAGMDDSNVASASYTIKEVVHGYAIDFEKPIAAYEDWTITNIGIHTSGLTAAHSGSAWGSNVNNGDNGTSTAIIQTKEKVAYPGTFTCYISKESSNTTSSSWKIQTSSDGSSWTDIATLSSMTQNTWTKFTGDIKKAGKTNVYVRLYYSGSTAKRAVDDITLTLEPAAGVDDGYGHLTLTTTENMAGWRTFYDASQDYEVDGNTKIYVAKESATAGEVELTALAATKIPAGEAVILKTTDANHEMVLTETTGAEALGANVLAVTDGSSNVDGYRLGYKSGTGIAFYKYTATAPAAGIVYIDKDDVNTGSSARDYLTFSFDEESETTGLNEVKTKKIAGEYFNLAGQRVANPTKGLYIVNGKKVILH